MPAISDLNWACLPPVSLEIQQHFMKKAFHQSPEAPEKFHGAEGVAKAYVPHIFKPYCLFTL